jgi:hypothetical protein
MDIKSIYCPRCGSPNGEIVKFCRQCGLPLAEVTGYLSSGGTSKLTPIQRSRNPLAQIFSNFTPRQKMILAIVLAVFSPAFFAALDAGEVSPLAAIFMPVVILFSVFYFRNQEKQLKVIQSAEHQAVPLPGRAAATTPYVPPRSEPVAIPSPTTSSLVSPQAAIPPGSVTEDETRKLAEPR